ncbi:YfcE family phosphodiesterase [Candidatus Geothermarchaeota archaeon ex4572_27]|nr:MAG: YfcE family phosphodiesterase [Candidatus Geothermarchaeota archaeon ex4572_27]
MKVGVISDTHDNKDAIARAVDLFNSEKVDLVLHGGDHVAPFTVRWLSGLKMRVVGVKGNLDAEYPTLARLYEERGWSFNRYSASLELEGRRLILIHGEDEEVVKALVSSGSYDVVVRGHLHKVINEWVGNTLHLSPGEACGYLTGRRTVAILRLPEISVEVIEI